jgi:ribonuclease D
MPSPQPTQLIQQRSEFGPLLDALAGASRVALDTEFHAERRYYPELMLVQFAFEDGSTWVVDPQSVDLSSLKEPLSSTAVIVHSGQQDIAILWRDFEATPTDVFDVQIAAGLLGHGYPTRLGTLVQRCLNLELSKGATLSNWAARPLSPNQIAYAVDDVRVLFPLANLFERELNQRNRLQWAVEASKSMAEQCQRRAPVNHNWAEWEIASQLDATTTQIMTNLFEWRDQKGRDKNQPPMYMLSDGLALDIARRKPQTVEATAENRRIPQGLIRRMGHEIVATVKKGIDNPPPLPFIPTRTEATRAQALNLWSLVEGARLDIAPKLLLPKKLALKVAHHGPAALDGWRSDAAGDSLASFLSGDSALRLTDDGPSLT